MDIDKSFMSTAPLLANLKSPKVHAHNREFLGVTEVFSPSEVTQRHIQEATPRTQQINEKKDQKALQISVVLNIVITVVKVFATIISGSLAVTATLVDSVLDVLSQFILFYTDSVSKKHNSAKFPAGRTRIAPLGVFICAVLMGMASVEVIHEAVFKLLDQYWNESPESSTDQISMNAIVLAAMTFSFTAKAWLYVYCIRVSRQTGNDSVKAVALDHLNDVLSILSATVAGLSSYYSDSLSWVDPVSAIAISIYIMKEWWETAKDQTNMLVGRAADDSFLEEIRRVGNKHHTDLRVDIIRAYHFGPKYLVELEVVLPPTMTLEMTHDIGMELQHKIEAFDEVERAFVHIDYQERDYDEHNQRSWPPHYAEKVRETIRKIVTDIDV
jgi:cation diffusion facilitator family transporter